MDYTKNFESQDEYFHPDKHFVGGLRKIREFTRKETCRDPEHNPPMHIVLSPGIYEYTCPACGRRVTFTVPDVGL